jgi:hypothetical protein
MNQPQNALSDAICLLLPTLLTTVVIQLIFFPSIATAGIVGDIADLGLKVAIIRHWKAFSGVVLLLGGAYLIAHKPLFKFKVMAIAASVTLWVITIWGGSLLLGEFWTQIDAAVTNAALFIRRLF